MSAPSIIKLRDNWLLAAGKIKHAQWQLCQFWLQHAGSVDKWVYHTRQSCQSLYLSSRLLNYDFWIKQLDNAASMPSKYYLMTVWLKVGESNRWHAMFFTASTEKTSTFTLLFIHTLHSCLFISILHLCSTLFINMFIIKLRKMEFCLSMTCYAKRMKGDKM